MGTSAGKNNQSATSAGANAADAPPSSTAGNPVLELFDYRTDPNLVGFREFHARPVEEYFKQLLSQPNHPSNIFVETAISSLDAAMPDHIRKGIEAKDEKDRTPMENYLLGIDYRASAQDLENSVLAQRRFFLHAKRHPTGLSSPLINHRLYAFARQNNAIAQAVLGEELAKATGPMLRNEGLHYLTLAGAQNEPFSLYYLHRIYLQGHFSDTPDDKAMPLVTIDEQKAEHYAGLAIRHGVHLPISHIIKLAIQRQEFGKAAAYFRFLHQVDSDAFWETFTEFSRATSPAPLKSLIIWVH